MNDLAKHVLEFFQTRYGSSTERGVGDLFLAFEAAGREVLASDFRNEPGDPDPSPDLALEYGSNLVDFFAEIDPDGTVESQTDLSPSVSGQYRALLDDARSKPGDDPTGFLKLLGRARTDFENQKRSLNLTEFWAAQLSPRLWFDDRDAAGWQKYTYSEGTEQPVHPGEPDTTTGPYRPSGWKWRVLTPNAAELWKAATRVQTLDPRSATLADLHAKQVTATKSNEQRMRILAAVAPALARGPAPAATARRATALPTWVGPATVRRTGVDATATPPLATVAGRTVVNLNSRLVRSVVLSGVLANLPKKAPNSSGLEVSFEYRVVDISRPWISAEFLTSQNWYLAGCRSGSKAAGSMQPGAGPMSYLPAKFLLTRNLAIRASWSEEDRRLASHDGASFGPFTLVNRTFENNTLSDPGMKIIGWFCEVSPILPPLSDPDTL